MSVDAKEYTMPQHATGLFTSACPTADVTETLGWAPAWVMIVLNTSATNPDFDIATAGDTTESWSLNGADGVVTSPAVAAGLDITATGFIVRSEIQSGNGTNGWIAFR